MEQYDEVHDGGDGHVMMMIKLLHGKEERETKTKVIKAKVSNRFLFWHSRHHRECECI